MRWSKASILDAIQEWQYMQGMPPKHDEWQSAGATHPNATTVKRHFGSWNNALREAGFEPRTNYYRGR